jgi:glycosyltransferase involved in cell wall biosynthesis
MDSNSTISIIIPFFNGESFILQLLESIELSYSIIKEKSEIEILIIIDSPETHTDDIERLVDKNTSSEFRKRIKVHKNSINLGVANTRNRGLQLSTGQFVTFIDQDDKLDIKYFNSLTFFINSEKLDFCIINGYYVHSDSNKRVPLYFFKPHFTFNNFLIQNRIQTTGLIIFRKSFLIKYHLSFVDADKSFKGCDDWYLYLSILMIHSVSWIFINRYLYLYNYHGSNYSSDLKRAINGSIATLKNFKRKTILESKMKIEHSLERLNFEMSFYGDSVSLFNSIKRHPLGFYYFLISRFTNLNRLLGFMYSRIIRIPTRN